MYFSPCCQPRYGSRKIVSPEQARDTIPMQKPLHTMNKPPPEPEDPDKLDQLGSTDQIEQLAADLAVKEDRLIEGK